MIFQDGYLEEEENGKTSPLLLPTPVEDPIEETTRSPQDDRYWVRPRLFSLVI